MLFTTLKQGKWKKAIGRSQKHNRKLKNGFDLGKQVDKTALRKYKRG
jgi:hypothetical protein